jgi:hypothetical protein
MFCLQLKHLNLFYKFKTGSNLLQEQLKAVAFVECD